MINKKILITRNTMAAGQAVRVGDVVELPEKEATFLMHIGKAMAAPAEDEALNLPSFSKMTVEQIKAFAAENGIELPAVANKAKMIQIIEAALAESEQDEGDDIDA